MVDGAFCRAKVACRGFTLSVAFQNHEGQGYAEANTCPDADGGFAVNFEVRSRRQFGLELHRFSFVQTPPVCSKLIESTFQSIFVSRRLTEGDASTSFFHSGWVRKAELSRVLGHVSIVIVG